MGLTKTQKIAVVGGVIISGSIAAYFVAKALAKEEIPPAKRYSCTGAPDYQCVQDPEGLYPSLETCLAACKEAPPTIPVGIEFPLSPYSLQQRYQPVIEWIAVATSHLICYPESKAGVQGYKTLRLMGYTVDAMGRGVPDVTVEVWTSATPDEHGGTLTVNGAKRTAVTPLELVTDSGGCFICDLQYRNTDMDWLCRQTCIGWDLLGRKWPITPCATAIFPLQSLWCEPYEAFRHVYALYARIKGTIRTGQAVVNAIPTLQAVIVEPILGMSLNDMPLLYPE